MRRFRAILAACAIASVASSCIVRKFTEPRLTGTCEGACAHYLECKPGHPSHDGDRCRAECPGVFQDPDSLMAFESLSCKDAVEFVDGTSRAATAQGNER